VSDRGGLTIERSDGSGARRLATIRTACTADCLASPGVAWSLDGTRIAVGGVDPRTTGFEVIDVANGRITPIAVPVRRGLYVPLGFSPNGRLLAYSLIGGMRRIAESELFVARPDGLGRRLVHRFHDSHDGAGTASWSPDSTRLAFTNDGADRRDPRFEIVNVRTGSQRALDPRHVYDQAPAWSPDGTDLAMAQSSGSVFTVASDGSDFHSLGLRGSTVAWLRNGDLLVGRGSSAHQAALFRIGHGPARTLFTLPYREVSLSVFESR
jgi:dipeptidyl aminopeptidase/acylaminoacyl peptidase